jgi:hypothetical protein
MPRDASSGTVPFTNKKARVSSMTDATPTISTTISVDTCPVCPHPADAHDALGRRYCAATAAGTLDRGCICAGRAFGK